MKIDSETLKLFRKMTDAYPHSVNADQKFLSKLKKDFKPQTIFTQRTRKAAVFDSNSTYHKFKTFFEQDHFSRFIGKTVELYCNDNHQFQYGTLIDASLNEATLRSVINEESTLKCTPSIIVESHSIYVNMRGIKITNPIPSKIEHDIVMNSIGEMTTDVTIIGAKLSEFDFSGSSRNVWNVTFIARKDSYQYNAKKTCEGDVVTVSLPLCYLLSGNIISLSGLNIIGEGY